MRRVLSLLILVLPVSHAVAAFVPGEKVVVIRQTPLKTVTVASTTLTPGSVLTFEAVEGDRLKVAAAKVGTIEASAVIHGTEAESHFTQLINSNPRDAAAIKARGKVRFEKGDHDNAIADFDRSIELAPDSQALTLRGFAWKRMGDKTKAMIDLDAAIKLNPEEALAWRVRGATWAGKADYSKALAHYSQSIKIDPENPETLLHRAVLQSACNDSAIRNGTQAFADATRACELTEWKNRLFLNALAAACAEKGDFDAAAKWQIAAMEKAPKAQAAAMQGRVDQYRRHQPFRTTWR